MNSVAGVILAGGGATRIGGEKALAPFLAGTLLDAVIARVQPQVSLLALSVPAGQLDLYRQRYGESYPLLLDPFPTGVGPLGGVIAGFEWLETLDGPRWLASFPCDTPFLPSDLVAQLAQDADDAPVAARDGSRIHGVCALWPLASAGRLRNWVEEGRLRSLRSALEALDGKTRLIAAEPEAFFNINTPEDLAAADEMARGRG